jgi:site-specific recombinase XerD
MVRTGTQGTFADLREVQNEQQTSTIDEIAADDIEGYKTRRASQNGKKTKRPIKPATINRELACLKAMYNHALKKRHDFRNPVSEIEFLSENNEQTRVLSFEEQRKYLASASDTLKDVATLMLETGMRPEEVYGFEKRTSLRNKGICSTRSERRKPQSVRSR